MPGGSRQQRLEPVRQTSSRVLEPSSQAIYDRLLEQVDNLNPQDLNLPDPTVAPATIVPFDPLETEAQDAAVASARGGDIEEFSTNLSDAANFLLRDAIRVESNPALGGFVDAAIRPLEEQFTQSVLPGIRSTSFGNTGLFGGSRQGIAEGLASQAFQNNVGDISSRILSDAYAQGLQAMLGGVQATPTIQAGQLFPSAVIDSVGASRRGLEQARADATTEAERLTRQNQLIQELFPYLLARDQISVLSGIPLQERAITELSGVTGTTSGGIGDRLTGAASGALQGAAAGSVIPGVGTVAGGTLGALVGLFGS